MNEPRPPDYAALAAALADHPPPVVVLDLDRLEANARAMLTRAGRLPIRLGSKSIRCVEVMKRVMALDPRFKGQIGRASCRERVCTYASFSVGAVTLKKKKHETTKT